MNDKAACNDAKGNACVLVDGVTAAAFDGDLQSGGSEAPATNGAALRFESNIATKTYAGALAGMRGSHQAGGLLKVCHLHPCLSGVGM